jgi:hypothetical protein
LGNLECNNLECSSLESRPERSLECSSLEPECNSPECNSLECSLECSSLECNSLCNSLECLEYGNLSNSSRFSHDKPEPNNLDSNRPDNLELDNRLASNSPDFGNLKAVISNSQDFNNPLVRLVSSHSNQDSSPSNPTSANRGARNSPSFSLACRKQVGFNKAFNRAWRTMSILSSLSTGMVTASSRRFTSGI